MNIRIKQPEFRQWIEDSLRDGENILAISNQGTILHYREDGLDLIVKTAMGRGAVRALRQRTLLRRADPKKLQILVDDPAEFTPRRKAQERDPAFPVSVDHPGRGDADGLGLQHAGYCLDIVLEVLGDLFCVVDSAATDGDAGAFLCQHGRDTLADTAAPETIALAAKKAIEHGQNRFERITSAKVGDNFLSHPSVLAHR